MVSSTTTSPTKNRGHSPPFASLVRRFESLVHDVHLPFLEVRLYRKYYIQSQSEHRAKDLRVVLDTMQRHRTTTLATLKLIHEREAIVRELKEKSEAFAAKKTSTLEVQTEVLQLLHAHQQVTLKVIESVAAWRSILTRPYPFHWKGCNYFRKVLDDCEVLDGCQLRSILPLRLQQFPLCSNISSLALFAPGGAVDASASARPSKLRGAVASGQTASDRTKAETARLREAEMLLFDDAELQGKLMRELGAVSASGFFVPLLNLSTIIPSCTTGIKISNGAWSRQVSEAIHDVATEDMRALVLADDTPPRSTRASRRGSTARTRSEPGTEADGDEHRSHHSSIPPTPSSARSAKSATSSQRTNPGRADEDDDDEDEEKNPRSPPAMNSGGGSAAADSDGESLPSPGRSQRRARDDSSFATDSD